MPAWAQSILDWIAANPHWGGLVIALVAFVESLAVVGIVVPGVVLLFGLATLIGAGVLPLWPSLFWAAGGAILGDQVSYWLGWHYRERLWKVWPLNRDPKLVLRSHAFVERFGIGAVVLGRFIGPIRPLVPAAVGMSAMPPSTFTAVNAISALAWAPVYILPGALFGATFEDMGMIGWVVGGITVLAVGMFWLSRRILRNR